MLLEGKLLSGNLHRVNYSLCLRGSDATTSGSTIRTFSLKPHHQSFRKSWLCELNELSQPVTIRFRNLNRDIIERDEPYSSRLLKSDSFLLQSVTSYRPSEFAKSQPDLHHSRSSATEGPHHLRDFEWEQQIIIPALSRKLHGGTMLNQEQIECTTSVALLLCPFGLHEALPVQLLSAARLEVCYQSGSFKRRSEAVYLIQESGLLPLKSELQSTDDAHVESCGPSKSQQAVLSAAEQAKRTRRKRRTTALLLLNVLAALYGASTVASRSADEAAPDLPASLGSLIRFSSAAIVFFPALRKALSRRNAPLLRAGLELALLSFAGTLAQSAGGSSGLNPPLLFAFTVFAVPILELGFGRRVNKTSWIATIAALGGMGLLEEENQDWQGMPLSLPLLQHLFSDKWSLLLGPIFAAIHIFRSEALASRHNALQLTAVQAAYLAALGATWEAWTFGASGADLSALAGQLHTVPWAPLLYSGLICSGLGNWLELRGLHHVHAHTATLVYTTIPIWGAFFAFLVHGDAPEISAVLGGTVILAASLSAQRAAGEEDEYDEATRPLQMTPTAAMSAGASDGFQAGRRSGVGAVPRSDDEEPAISPSARGRSVDEDVTLQAHDDRGASPSEKTLLKKTSKKAKASDGSQLQAALLTSQLKFPFYATQAQHLLTQAKLKLAAAKSALVALEASALGWANQQPPGGASSAVSSASSAASGATNLGATAQHAASAVASNAGAPAAGVNAVVTSVFAAAGHLAAAAASTLGEALFASIPHAIPDAVSRGALAVSSAQEESSASISSLSSSLEAAVAAASSTAVALGSETAAAVAAAGSTLGCAALELERHLAAAAGEARDEIEKAAAVVRQHIIVSHGATAGGCQHAAAAFLGATPSNNSAGDVVSGALVLVNGATVHATAELFQVVHPFLRK
eukprot:jgi/Mesen1/1676/ME000137S00592